MSSPSPETADRSTGFVGRLKAWREGIRRRPPLNLAYRVAVTVIGFAIILVGLLLLALPGPGWLVVFLGLAVLSTEYEWSRRLLAYARAKVKAWTEWLRHQSVVVRALVGLVCLLLVLAFLYAALWWYGTTWLPDWVPLVHDLPTRS